MKPEQNTLISLILIIIFFITSTQHTTQYKHDATQHNHALAPLCTCTFLLYINICTLTALLLINDPAAFISHTKNALVYNRVEANSICITYFVSRFNIKIASH